MRARGQVMKNDFDSFDGGLQSFETDGIEESSPNNSSFSSFGLDSESTPGDSVDTNALEANTLEDYGTQIVRALNTDGIAPTPYNYRIYFEKLLENKNQEFKDNATQMISSDLTPTERQALLEDKVLKAKNYMVNTLQQVGATYNNLQILQNILKKHESEVSAVNNTIALQNIITVFEKELNKLGETTKAQLQNIKDSYDRSIQAIESIGKNIICDDKYGFYNRNFLDIRIASELESIYRDNYSSSLILIQITKNLALRINSDKNTMLVNRAISKILQKVVNKSDVLSHCGSGIFGVLLSHSNKDSAKRFANRLIEKVAMANIFLGEEEVHLSVCTGIVEINANSKNKDIFKNALEALKKASNSNVSFVVAGEGKEKK